MSDIDSKNARYAQLSRDLSNAYDLKRGIIYKNELQV